MLILVIPYLAVFALAIFELRGALANRAIRTPDMPAWLWLIGIVAMYVEQLALIRFGATHATPLPPWRLTMPLPVLYIGTWNADWVSASFLAAGALQSYALLALYRGNVSRLVTGAGLALLLGISLAAPALSSFDLYGYVHNGILGFESWAPPNVRFPGEFHVIDLWFGHPTYTLYGPLWLIIVQLVTVLPATLLGKIMALRVFNACLYLALLVAMRALGLPRRILVVTALNPGLMLQFVANGHNDLIAIVLIAVAAAVMRRNPIAGFGLIAVAGAVKLPYVVLGLPVAAMIVSPWRRYFGCAAAIAAALAISWFGGGKPYWHVLTYHAFISPLQNALHVIPVFCALVAIAVAVAGGRRLMSAVWLLPTLGAFGLPLIFPWYLIWGFPYALARHRILGGLLVGFPFVGALVLPEFTRVWTLLLVFPMIVVMAYRTPPEFLQKFDRGPLGGRPSSSPEGASAS
ncbi:MAG: hypothetical protein ACLQPV_09380 [Vulcanimicrobiaceae bacterium]